MQNMANFRVRMQQLKLNLCKSKELPQFESIPMKKLLTISSALVLFVCFATGQSGKMNFSLQKQMSQARQTDHEVAVFIKGDANAIRSLTESLGGVFKYSAGDISAIRIPLSKIPQLAASGQVQRIENNDLNLQPMNNQMLVNNHALEVQQGFNLPQDYNGEGVVVGIIDEGIDYTHPDFRDEYGRTRIKYLWDQAIINYDTGTQAQPYGYGKEYVGNQIDTSTQHYDSPFSHGSHVAGIACGSGLALNNYKGVAPNADIIIVKMNLNRPDNEFLSSLVDAIKYIFDRADDLGEPAVINVSLGTYFGSHDGKDIQAQAIDNLINAKPGRVVVCSAGNAGSAPLHLTNTVTSDTNFTWLQMSSQSIYIQAWGDSADFENIQFSLGIDRVNHGYTLLNSLPFHNVLNNLGVLTSDTLYQGANQLGVIQGLSQYWNGNYSVEFLIYPDSVTNITPTDTSRYLWRFMTTGSGHYDGWSYDMVFDNLPDSVSYPQILKYKKPDTDQTIVSSFTCSDKVITVGSYINRNFYTNANYAITRDTNLVVGALSGFSSHGPTRDGRIKPDITATGEWLISCGTQSELNLLAAIEPEKVAAGKKHKRSSGTSMSSPVVAGIAALYLQKNPTARWDEVKNAIINCADKDAFTGNNLPDNRWGYGKINAYGMVKGCTVGIDELDHYANVDFGTFPNPFENSTTLHYDLSSIENFHSAEIVVSDLVGSEMKKIKLKDKVNTLDLSRGNWAPGMYNCSLLIDGKPVKINKLIIL